MMKEIHKDWILGAERRDINSFGSHCYFGVGVCWIGVIHPGLLHKTTEQDRIRNDRKALTTLLCLEVTHPVVRYMLAE